MISGEEELLDNPKSLKFYVTPSFGSLSAPIDLGFLFFQKSKGCHYNSSPNGLPSSMDISITSKTHTSQCSGQATCSQLVDHSLVHLLIYLLCLLSLMC